MSVLFADLAGYTALSERLDPEDLVEVVAPGLARLQAIVAQFGGVVVQVQGDGILAVFGVPAAHEDDPERAVRAAIAVRDAARTIGEPSRSVGFPEVHAGIATGEVMVMPSDDPSGFRVTGDTVNVAARIADRATAGRVLVDESTRASAGPRISYGRSMHVRVKGKADPLRLAEALGATRPERRRPRGRVHGFVGREAALRRLGQEVSAAARAGTSRTFTIVGEAGLGKSRLVEEFARRNPELTFVTGACSPYGDARPMHALVHAVLDAAGVDPDAPDPEIARAVDSLARRSAGAGRSLARARDLRALVGVGHTGDDGRAIADARRGARLVLEAIATGGPLVIVLDDLQWADPDLRDLWADLRRRPWDGPILVLGLSRPDGGPVEDPDLVLGGLDEDSMRALAHAVLGPGAPAEVLEQVVTRAGGSPLFLEEIIGMLVDAGALVRGRAAWRLSDPAQLEAVPSSLRPLIAEHLDALPADEREVVALAAVCGEETWDGLLAALLPDDPVAALRALTRRGLLLRHRRSPFAGTVEYGLKHTLLAEVAYEELPRRERVRLHRLIATWIEDHETTPGEHVTTVALHLERAWRLGLSDGSTDDPEVAGGAARALGAWADTMRTYQARAAASLYDRALSVLDSGAQAEPELRARLLIGRAECRIEMGEHRGAARDAREARDAAAGARDDRLLAQALVARARIASDAGRFSVARSDLDEAFRLAVASKDLSAQGWALHRLSETWAMSDYSRELDELRRAYGRFVEADDRLGQGVAAGDLAFLLSMMGGPEFRHWYRAAHRLLRDGDLRSRAGLLRTWGYYCLYRGDRDDALGAMREARPLAVEAGERYAEADTVTTAALAAATSGRLAEATTLVADGMALGRELRSVRILAGCLMAGSEVALRTGDPEGAARSQAAAREHARRSSHELLAGEVALKDAELALHRGSWSKVTRPTVRAEGAIDAAHWLLLEPVPDLIRGRAALGAGRIDQALEALGRAHERARSRDCGGTRELTGAALDQARALAGGSVRARAVPRDREAFAIARETQGIVALRSGDADRAAITLGEAVAAWDQLGTTVWLARATSLLARARRTQGDRHGAAAERRRAALIAKKIGLPSSSLGSVLEPVPGR